MRLKAADFVSRVSDGFGKGLRVTRRGLETAQGRILERHPVLALWRNGGEIGAGQGLVVKSRGEKGKDVWECRAGGSDEFWKYVKLDRTGSILLI